MQTNEVFSLENITRMRYYVPYGTHRYIRSVFPAEILCSCINALTVTSVRYLTGVKYFVRSLRNSPLQLFDFLNRQAGNRCNLVLRQTYG